MMSETLRPAEATAYLRAPDPIPQTHGGGLADDRGSRELSPGLRADLLDFNAWGQILSTYGRTMQVAVALTDPRGQVLGRVHNAQPVWSLVHAAGPAPDRECPFCITTGVPCTAVAEAFRTGGAVVARDQAGLTHVAVPLLLDQQRLGSVIAGQVFDRYPDPLSLRRVAREFDVPADQLWAMAKKQRPVSTAHLLASGDLLGALGQAFLLQRYGAILESRLADTNGRFRLLVEGIRDYALFTMDPDGRVTSWNSGAERMLGYAKDEIVGRSFSCIFTAEDLQNRLPAKQLREALRAGRSEDEGWRLGVNRKQFLAHVNITPLLDGAGPARGFAIIVQDVTEQRKAALVLEGIREERARLQEKFLSHVSHELRTPLTAIYFFVTNVLDGLMGELTPEQREHLAFALDNVKQLKDMVSDLLDITRVDGLKLTVSPRHTSSARLISDVLGTCRTHAAAKNISLLVDVPPGLPFVWADPARVRQILTNLIDNAIKFTPEGGTITVASRPFDRDRCLCLSVSDTGCGISTEDREIVFDRLVQIKGGGAEASRAGLGLGLFISRELVSQHGGRIWVDSEPGHGSTFSFTLPVFSLAKLCADVFTAPNLAAGCVTLIAVDVVAVPGTVQAEVVPEIRRVLERCIHTGQDVLLPPMSDADPVETFFIVACTDAAGSNVIAARIGRELHEFDTASRLEPAISSTTLLLAPGQAMDEQIRDVSRRIDGVVQAHFLGRETLK